MTLSNLDNYAGTVMVHPLGIVKKNISSLSHDLRRRIVMTPAYLHKQSWTSPATISTNYYAVSHAGAGTAGTTSQTIAHATAQDGYARNVVITVTHASAVVAMSGTITGTNIQGTTISEAWSVTAGTTSKTFTGAKAFKTITSITETIAADASANTIISGDGKKLGLKYPNTLILPIGETEDGATPTAGVLVAGVIGSTTVDNFGTYTPNSTLNASKSFRIYYIVDDPTTLDSAV